MFKRQVGWPNVGKQIPEPSNLAFVPCSLVLPIWHYATESSGSGVSDFQPRLYCSLPQKSSSYELREVHMDLGEEHVSRWCWRTRQHSAWVFEKQPNSFSCIANNIFHELFTQRMHYQPHPGKKQGEEQAPQAGITPAKISFLPRKVRAVIKGSCQWQIR